MTRTAPTLAARAVAGHRFPDRGPTAAVVASFFCTLRIDVSLTKET